jgi:outer membrane protein assembly factor BamB
MDGNQSGFHGDSLVTGDLVVIGTDGGDGHVYAFDKSWGSVRWKYPVPRGVAQNRGVTSDIVRLGPAVFGVTIGDELISLDVESGKPRWTYESAAPRKEPVRGSTPAVEADRVFFAGLDGTLVALDAGTGKPIWKRALGAPASTPLTLAGDDLYVGVESDHFFRIDKRTGAIAGDLLADGQPFGRPTLAAGSLLVYLNWRRPGSEIVAFDPALTGVRWRRKLGPDAGAWSSPRTYPWRGTILAGTTKGELYALKPEDGSIAWTHRFPGEIKGIGTTDDLLYVGTMSGMLYAYRPPRAAGP